VHVFTQGRGHPWIRETCGVLLTWFLADRVHGALQDGAFLHGNGLEMGFKNEGALFELEVDVLLRLDALEHVAPPRSELIRPRFDGVAPQPDLVRSEATGPSVVADGGHEALGPRPGAGPPDTQDGLEQSGPIPQDVGGDLELVAGHGLSAETSAVDLRFDPLDDDVSPAQIALQDLGIRLPHGHHPRLKPLDLRPHIRESLLPI
jgi:hypothetical protein